MIGVNNQYRGRDAEEFRLQYNDLLDTALKYAGNNPEQVFVLSIPDWGAMPFAENRDQKIIAKEIDLFNQIKKEETLKRGILFLDITPISRKARQDETLVATDQLHPSGEMYSEWVKEVLPQIVDLIK